MDMVDVRQRIASSFWRTSGQRGSITRHARERGVSRQRIYRESRWVQERLRGDAAQRELAAAQARIRELERVNQELLQKQASMVCFDADTQAEFACVGQAEGVSLPTARTLMKVVAKGKKVPSVAKLGRWTKEAGKKAGRVLEELDTCTRPLVEQVAADEIYTKKPVLMMVEPDSLCWVHGQLSAQVTGGVWGDQFKRFLNLRGIVHDAGTGLCHGVDLVKQERRAKKAKPVADKLDHFHSVREGGLGLARVAMAARRAYRKAEAAQKQLDKRVQNGQSISGFSTKVTKLWAKAEKAFDVWQAKEQAWQQAKQALILVTPEGELNTRAHAQEALSAALAPLPDAQFGKGKRLLMQPETLSYLDEVHDRLDALAAPPEVKEAAVKQECLRRRPELLQGTSTQAAAMRGLLLVCATILAKSGDVGKDTAEAVRKICRTSWRASSLIECLNSALRMQQARHRKMSQGLIDLKRLSWNCHEFRTGRRRGQSPYERLGLRLPPDLPWWQMLKMSPEQLREKLSALQVTK
jgi:hypothetical protein